MKENIPFSEFYEYYKENKIYMHSENQDLVQHVKREQAWFKIMERVRWEDFESLSPDEMIKIPIWWVYDWTHVTAHYGLQEKVEQLYTRYKLPIYTVDQYLNYFKKDDKMNHDF